LSTGNECFSTEKKESNKGKTFVSPLFLLLHRGKLNPFPSERAKGKDEIFREILHFWENFHGSGITSYKAVFPDENVFDPRSVRNTMNANWRFIVNLKLCETGVRSRGPPSSYPGGAKI
jgi:hypothetical protein